MIVSQVGRRGQITLPSAIRRQLNVGEGDRIAFVKQNDCVVLLPLSKTLLDMRGSIPVPEPQDFDAIRSEVLGARARRDAQAKE